MIKDFYDKYNYVEEFLESKNKYNYDHYPSDSDYLISKHILDVLSELSELQSLTMKNSIGNISKIMFRIKYTYSRVVTISNNIINELLIMVNEFTLFIATIHKHFQNSGYMDINNYESEKHILIITSWLNPLNVKELLNSETKLIFLEELKSVESEQRMHIPKKRRYINSTASDLFILDNEIENYERDIDSFLNYIIEIYKDFASTYYNESQDIIEKYDKFDVISYWKTSVVNKHNCYDILQLIIQKYLCIDPSEIICESSFRKSKLVKSSLRINMSGSSISDIMFVLENQKLSFDCITKKIEFYVVLYKTFIIGC